MMTEACLDVRGPYQFSAGLWMTDQEEIRQRFGAYVRQARGFNRSQGAVARVWGKSQATVSDVENGKTLPDRADIPALAAALNRPVKEVLEAAGYQWDLDLDELTREPDPERDLVLEAFEGADPFHRRLMVNLAKEIRQYEKDTAKGGKVAGEDM